VTVNNTGRRAETEGRLRACMGIIEAREPLVEAIVSAAVSAAHDPRFPPLTAEELDEMELEVSVLSPTSQVAGPEAIEVGRHGVVLSKSGRRAVFLPQVAPEQGWTRDEMLSHLARKAGLPADAWRQGATFEVFTAQVIEEGS
jgi:AmmeMemoRadiSam system protein A